MIFRDPDCAKTSSKIHASCLGCSKGTAWPQFFNTLKWAWGAFVDINFENAERGVVKSSSPITTLAFAPA